MYIIYYSHILFTENIAENDIPVKENEAYATVNVTHYLKTLPNEAYATHLVNLNAAK